LHVDDDHRRLGRIDLVELVRHVCFSCVDRGCTVTRTGLNDSNNSNYLEAESFVGNPL
jgi:hypothetical protein